MKESQTNEVTVTDYWVITVLTHSDCITLMYPYSYSMAMGLTVTLVTVYTSCVHKKCECDWL